MSGSALFMGQGGADPDTGAVLWQMADGADDAGEAFQIFALSNWIAPPPSIYAIADPMGNYVFLMAYLTVTWSMAVTIRVTPVVDEVASSVATGFGSLRMLPVEFTLAAPSDGRQTQTFVVPLERAILDASGTDLGRNNVVGRRLRLQVESTGGLTAGSLILAGAEVEFERAIDAEQQEATA